MRYFVAASLVAYVWFFAGVAFWRVFTSLGLGFDPREPQRRASH